jgi:hypothetical protein
MAVELVHLLHKATDECAMLLYLKKVQFLVGQTADTAERFPDWLTKLSIIAPLRSILIVYSAVPNALTTSSGLLVFAIGRVTTASKSGFWQDTVLIAC